jgi:hypothetical protein
MGHETYCLYQNSLLIITLYFHCAGLHFHAMFNCLAAPIVFPSLLFLYFQPHMPDVFQQFVYMLALLQSTWYNCSVWLSGWLAGCLAGWLAGSLAGCLAGWLTGWFAGWLSGWLAGWLAGCPSICLIYRLKMAEWVCKEICYW